MRKNLGLAIVLSLALLACTRKSGDTSNLRLSFMNSSGNSILSVDDIPGTIIVTISGSGVTSKPYQWHKCKPAEAAANPTRCALPTGINFDVPFGSSRLIQVLFVYEGGEMSFSYGDSVKDINTPTSSVDITVLPIGSAKLQGTVAGRYLDGSATGGPNGKLDAYFLPPGGRPAMKVMQSAMFAGWFNLFLLDNANFTYKLNDKTLFENVNINSPQFNGTANRVRLNIPAYDRINSDGMDSETPSKVILGYFGPSAGSNTACYNYAPSPQPISGAFLPGTTDHPLLYSSSASAAAAVVHPESGGALSTSSICSNPDTLFMDHLSFDEKMLRNGHDSIAGFKGPWRLTNGGQISGSVANGQATLNWTFLPDTTKGSDGVAGVSASSRPRPETQDESIYGQNGIDCTSMADFGFSNLNADVTMKSGDTAGSMTIPGYSPDQQVVLCPFTVSGTTKVYSDNGADFYGGGGGGGMMQMQVVLAHAGTIGDNFAASDTTQGEGTCKPYVLKLQDFNGATLTNPGTSPLYVNINGLDDGSGDAFASEYSDCMVSTPGVSIAPGASSTIVYIQATNLPFSAFVGMQSGDGSVWGQAHLNFVGSSNPYKVRASVNVYPSAMVAGQCYPIQYDILPSSGNGNTYLTTNGLLSPSVAPAGAGSFYTDPNCTLAPSFTVPAFESTYTLYFKPGNTATSGAYISGTISGVSSSEGSNTFDIDLPTPFTYWPMLQSMQGNPMGSTFQNGSLWAAPGCSSIFFQALTAHFAWFDQNHQPAPTVATVNIIGGGKFYTKPDCSDAGSAALTNFSLGGYSSSPRYFKNSGSTVQFQVGTGATQTFYILPSAINLQTTGAHIGGTGVGDGLAMVASLRDENNALYVVPGSSGASVTINSGGGVVVMANPSGSCMGSSQTSLAVQNGHAVGYVCEQGPISMISLSATFNNMVWSNQVTVDQGTASTAVSQVTILGPLGSGNNIGVKANSCESLLAFATDSEGHWNWQTTSSGAQATLSGSGVTAANTALYNSNSCATPTVTGNATPTTTTNIGAGSALELFFETTAAATPQLTYSSSSPTASGVVNITPN